MGERTLAACREHGCVYLHAVGGAAQVLAECITPRAQRLFPQGIRLAGGHLGIRGRGLPGGGHHGRPRPLAAPGSLRRQPGRAGQAPLNAGGSAPGAARARIIPHGAFGTPVFRATRRHIRAHRFCRDRGPGAPRYLVASASLCETSGLTCVSDPGHSIDDRPNLLGSEGVNCLPPTISLCGEGSTWTAC